MLETRQESPEETPWGCLSGIAGPPQVPIDSNGNLTAKTEGSDSWTYTWNAENQLTKVEKNGAEQARFAYDPRGRRVEKVAGGLTTSYTYDGSNILREVRGSTTLKYVHGPGIDEPLAVHDGTAMSYFQADALGTMMKMTNAAGAVTLTRQYDAWGNLEAGAGEPGYAFTGREWDPETALYYYRARYYEPRIGRFLSEDPLGYAENVNFYAYVSGNPATFDDPSGLSRGGTWMPPGLPCPVLPPYPPCRERYLGVVLRLPMTGVCVRLFRTPTCEYQRDSVPCHTLTPEENFDVPPNQIPPRPPVPPWNLPPNAPPSCPGRRPCPA